MIKVNVRGLRDFTRDLKQLEGDLHKELKAVNRKVADLMADRARSASPAGVQKAIRARGTQRGAFVDITNRPPRALGVFLGMKQRSGWYSHPRYRNSAGRQFKPWVGNAWDPGETGGEPYFVGPAINRSIENVLDLFGDEIEKLAARTFPD